MPKYPDYYILSRCRKNNTLYGKIHISYDSCMTLCGKQVDENWWILYPGARDATCKKCRKLDGENQMAIHPEIKKELREIREMNAKLSNVTVHDDRDIIELRDIPRDQAKKEIADYFSERHGNNINSFQISVDLRIDEDVVDEICEELLKEGRIAEAK